MHIGRLSWVTTRGFRPKSLGMMETSWQAIQGQFLTGHANSYCCIFMLTNAVVLETQKLLNSRVILRRTSPKQSTKMAELSAYNKAAASASTPRDRPCSSRAWRRPATTTTTTTLTTTTMIQVGRPAFSHTAGNVSNESERRNISCLSPSKTNESPGSSSTKLKQGVVWSSEMAVATPCRTCSEDNTYFLPKKNYLTKHYCLHPLSCQQPRINTFSFPHRKHFSGARFCVEETFTHSSFHTHVCAHLQ